MKPPIVIQRQYHNGGIQAKGRLAIHSTEFLPNGIRQMSIICQLTESRQEIFDLCVTSI